MRFEKFNGQIHYLYHYTTKENAKKILSEKCLNTGNDRFCFFTQSPEAARLLFAELMRKNTDYIDDALQVSKRIPQNPDNYVILKIEATNDSEFYRFMIDTEKFNPYDYSVLHRGALYFDKASVLPMVAELPLEGAETTAKKSIPFANTLKRSIAACFAAALMGLSTIPALAVSEPTSSWTDAGNYDATWYNDSLSSFTLTGSAQLAGLVKLVEGGNDFSEKTIYLKNDMDLSIRNWTAVPASFRGTVEGVHKVVLTLFSSDIPFAEDMTRFNNIDIRYQCERDSVSVHYSVAPTYTVTIPSTVTLGENAEVKAENVVVEKGKQVAVTLTGTSADDNSFKLTTEEGAELSYTVKNGETTVALNDTVLTVNPSSSATGSATLKFEMNDTVQYAGAYTGTVTFTVSVETAS